MADKKLPKNTFYCERCGAPCMIYRKGKAHRVLVCPSCGVLATNGIIKKIGKRVLRAAVGEIPGGSTVMEAGGLVKDLLSGDEKSIPSTTPQIRRKDHYYIEKALGADRRK